MKKILNIFSILFLIMILSSCITSQDEVNKAKQNLWIIDWWNNVVDSWVVEKTNSDTWMEWDNKTDEEVDEENIVDNNENIREEVKKIEIKSLTDNQLLQFDDLSNKDLLWGEVEITWKTLWKVDKIVVNFVNEDSDFPVDKYTLKQFKPGDETFLYRAFSRYETLDFWKNVYIFEAYSWDEVTKLELILNVFEDQKKQDKEETLEDVNVSNLPSNEMFWTPTDLWNGKVTYSDLNWLEIKRSIIPELTCEKVTSVLADEINWYFYWNTCRPIKDNEWVSFYVVRLDWDKYVYEKHYYLPYQWLYWIQELETGTWVTSENIWAKNSELKEKNEDFWIVKISDELFKEILK